MLRSTLRTRVLRESEDNEVGSMPFRPIRTFTVLPHLPERLQALQKLAYNLWWCWNHEAVALFRRIDVDLWETVDHSPVKLLGALDQARVEQLLHDDGFLAHLDRVEEAFDSYLSSPTWYQETYLTGARNGPAGPAVAAEELRVAYFSAEFGIHESIPVYSGGLGVLSGPPQKRQRPGHPPGRRRPDVPRGLLPPIPHRGRLAAGAL